ncbi:hypothetical protein BOTBODRAFT_278237 [Botryobasidium botryosum FD-172 SS1]|uniref:Uncharacterized protein n=1 Tax=Botryobasidium botryosum (strain FD-172 SS1) TaxID=930990 RepID=A0A067MKA7_BOTB1|nr:hypothetical protein BOTBODRAFT_278237 [Botryobasidium botryosum FD-172 SS1]
MAHAFLCTPQITDMVQREIWSSGQLLSPSSAISLEDIDARIKLTREKLPESLDSEVINRICHELLMEFHPFFIVYADECLNAVISGFERALPNHGELHPSWNRGHRSDVLAKMYGCAVQARAGIWASGGLWQIAFTEKERTDAEIRDIFKLERKHEIEFSTAIVEAFCDDGSKTQDLLKALQAFGLRDFQVVEDLVILHPDEGKYEEALTVIARTAAFWVVEQEAWLDYICNLLSGFTRDFVHDSLCPAPDDLDKWSGAGCEVV